MERIRNIAFAAICACILFAAIGNNLMPWFTGRTLPAYSYLEGRTLQTFPELSAAGFAEKSTQDQTEAFLADTIPCRNQIILGNASMQRMSIGLSNLAFGYPAMQTFYGSSYVLSPAEGRLYEAPYGKADWAAATSGLAAYAELVARHPSIRWRFELLDRSATTAESPAAPLVSDHADYRYFRDELSRALGDSSLLLPAPDVSLHGGDYFESDHHMQIQGSMKVYRDIIGAFGREPIVFGDCYELYKGKFYGSLARLGLDNAYYDSPVYDVKYRHGTYKVSVNGEKKDMGYLCSAWRDKPYKPLDTFFNAYSGCFHGDQALIDIVNPKAQEGTLLIVGDSFTDNFDRFFAESYRHVIVVDLRHYSDTLESLLSENEVDDCVFIMAADTMLSDYVIDSLR